MPWNSDGPTQGPWGAPPDDGGKRPNGAGQRGPSRPPNRGPWGGGGGGGGNGGPGLPDFDRLLAQAQAWVRSLLPGRGGSRRGVLLGAIALVAIWLATGFYRVQPDEQGVVLRFGALVGTTPPGLNYHLPWPIETVLLPAVTRINRIDVGYRSNPIDSSRPPGTRDLPAREVPEESLMLTGDENIIDINFAVFWRVRDAGRYLFSTRNPAQTVKSAAESVMREVIGSTPIQPALAEARAKIESSVLSGTQAILDQYQAGIEINQVQLQRVDPPAAVIDSFRDVQRANTDAERMRNEAETYRNDIVPRARGDAARVIAEAEGVRQSSIADATGQAQRFLSVLAAYQASRDITLRRLYIETMQDILSHTPSVVVDDQVRGVLPLLPLGEQGGAPSTLPGIPSASPPSPVPPPSFTAPPRSGTR